VSSVIAIPLYAELQQQLRFPVLAVLPRRHRGTVKNETELLLLLHSEGKTLLLPPSGSFGNTKHLKKLPG
jgi:hypothetical protein